MANSFDARDMSKALFMNLVMMFGTTAMQHLGKLVNPMTGKTEVDLEGAQASIDMLDMLREKTRGNLDADEERTMKQTLSTLQLNFVETSAAAAAKPQEAVPGKPEAATESKPESAAAPVEQGTAGNAHKDPKYHKTYG